MRIKYWTTDDIRHDNAREMSRIQEVSFGSVQPNDDGDRAMLHLNLRTLDGAPAFLAVTDSRIVNR
ncbi:hypothetical protein [Corynebacterium nuruki]|uniref:hypothetical protein n=1 Tax=Corynebacterium nuruki TaxID=1032851 RepID=UPI002FE1BE34